MNTVATAGVDAAGRVGVDTCEELACTSKHLRIGRERTIGDEGSSVGKSLAILPSTILAHVERVDRGGRREVAAVESKSNASVGDVGLVAIRGEGDTYRLLAESTGRA